MSPCLSVIIPAYNCASTLKILLQSLSQSHYKDFEVVVVDDGSKDKTVAVARSLGARIIQQEKNQGPGAARNWGAKEARGQFVLFLDSDTAVFPETLTEVMNALQEPGNDVVLGVYDKEPLNTGFFPSYYALLKHYAQSAVRITQYNVFAAHCAALRRALFLESGGFHHFPKGIDIENEELGRRLYRMGANIVFEPRIRIRHHFAGFRKLIYIFVRRTYWWMRVFLLFGEFEQSLTTKSFGLGTLAGPAAIALLAAAFVLPSTIAPIFYGSAILGFSMFLYSYGGFLRLCLKEKGWFFALRSAASCLFFSFLVSYGAGMGLAAAILSRLKLRKQELALGEILQGTQREIK